MIATRRGDTNFDPPNRLQPTRTPTSQASGHQPAPGNTTATASAAREIVGLKKHAHSLAHLVEKRTATCGVTVRPGVSRAHLACHEHTAGALDGVMGVCGRVEGAGGWLRGGRGLL